MKNRAQLEGKTSVLALEGQAFDSFFLKIAPLYLRSRKLYLELGGQFEPRLVTSPRNLSSPILLENRIQYSPTEDELLWLGTDPSQRTQDENLQLLVSYSTSLFHEQNHRIFWKWLPLPQSFSDASLSRYLNFVEAVVVGFDMALGDEMGPSLSSLGYLTGTLYDPGSYARFKDTREKRNYLHTAIRTTYLALEYEEKSKIRREMRSWCANTFPLLRPEVADHAIQRALRLDDAFIRITNPLWQEKHLETFRMFVKKNSGARASRTHSAPLDVPSDPKQWSTIYLAVEALFDRYRIR